ncbi:flagellar hook-associated family protein [Pannonibacter sp. SL95]|jgi:flagellar hook-associated protein 3 FlgL|uniref:flagellar hook-associated family protein n=1 Tax=Pannonibacter sp. SL95 TaxID=2995153 RepID=UPI002274DFA8|nr:flagellar hook-associated family protein [Pannonibacter sp. SL95]MCY1707176.1 flagellar hook-associated family protein [Pannonibacter sp. SL95]
MKTSYISTFTLSDSSRSLLQRQTANLAKLQIEISSGRKADIGLDLGARTGEAVSVRAEHTRLDAMIDTNALTASRLDVTQAALKDLLTTTQESLATLVAVRDSNGSASVAKGQAEGSLKLLISRLNTQLGGTYIFSGINTDAKPVTDYFATPASASKTAVDAAFTGAFGFNQSNPGVATITPAAMTAFLNGPFDALFADPQWGATWSTATNQTMTSQISPAESLNSSVSANEKPMRQLAAAFTMMADLGAEGLGKETYKVVVDKAISLLGEAVVGVTNLKGEVGLAQSRVSAASDRLEVQTNILNKRVNSLELVDKEETAVRLNTAITQLETTYAVSSRIQRLSILNFL